MEGKVMNDKQTIMKFLKECADLQNEFSFVEAREKGLINRIKEIDQGVGNITYKNLNASIVAGVIGSSIVMGIMGTPFAAVIIAFFARPAEFIYATFHWAFANEHPYWTHILFSFVLVSILAIPIAIAMCKEQKEGDVKRFESYQDALAERPTLVKELGSIPRHKQKIQSHLKQLASCGILHPDYIRYADKLWWYFEKGRADTLKEAINLLEHDLIEDDRREIEQKYHEEMRQQAIRQQETLDYIADESSRAADAAQSAASWSATGVLLTAAEIKRQREKDS